MYYNCALEHAGCVRSVLCVLLWEALVQQNRTQSRWRRCLRQTFILSTATAYRWAIAVVLRHRTPLNASQPSSNEPCRAHALAFSGRLDRLRTTVGVLLEVGARLHSKYTPSAGMLARAAQRCCRPAALLCARAIPQPSFPARQQLTRSMTRHAAAPGAVATPAPPPSASKEDIIRQLESRMGALDTRPMVPPPKPSVIVISGPSGVGKDAVVARLKAERPNLHFVVTATSR